MYKLFLKLFIASLERFLKTDTFLPHFMDILAIVKGEIPLQNIPFLL